MNYNSLLVLDKEKIKQKEECLNLYLFCLGKMILVREGLLKKLIEMIDLETK